MSEGTQHPVDLAPASEYMYTHIQIVYYTYIKRIYVLYGYSKTDEMKRPDVIHSSKTLSMNMQKYSRI